MATEAKLYRYSDIRKNTHGLLLSFVDTKDVTTSRVNLTLVWSKPITDYYSVLFYAKQRGYYRQPKDNASDARMRNRFLIFFDISEKDITELYDEVRKQFDGFKQSFASVIPAPQQPVKPAVIKKPRATRLITPTELNPNAREFIPSPVNEYVGN